MTSTDYTIAQKVIHWLMAILITLDLFVAQKFGDTMEAWDRLESRVDHGTLGSIVAILFIIRLYLRYRHGAPALPASMPSWQLRTARVGHGLLYFLIGFLIASGLATAINAASPVPLFGTFDITIGQLDETQFQFMRQFHELATNAVIAIVVIHVLAAIYHQWIVKDHLTMNMLKFWRRM